MKSNKCLQCGLVNFADTIVCKRCNQPLLAGFSGDAPLEEADVAAPPRRTLIKSLAAISGAVLLVLFTAYISLHQTSEPLDFDKQIIVRRATDLLEVKGFANNAFMLRHIVSYRASDNWWNRWVGHNDAYAATNFPFQVVTLYPDFFRVATNDTERAVVLLHESFHLFGKGEPEAFAGVWRAKHRLGWTKGEYGHTQVWRNSREFTERYAPQLFRCGLDKQSDCTE